MFFFYGKIIICILLFKQTTKKFRWTKLVYSLPNSLSYYFSLIKFQLLYFKVIFLHIFGQNFYFQFLLIFYLFLFLFFTKKKCMVSRTNCTSERKVLIILLIVKSTTVWGNNDYQISILQVNSIHRMSTQVDHLVKLRQIATVKINGTSSFMKNFWCLLFSPSA